MKFLRLLMALPFLLLYGCPDQSLLDGDTTILAYDSPIGMLAEVTPTEGEAYTLAHAVDLGPTPTMLGTGQGSNLYSLSYVNDRAFGPELNLTLARRTVGNAVAEPFVLGLRFYNEVFDPENLPTEEDLMEYFSTGRVFKVGEGRNKVRFGALLRQADGTPGNYRSRTDLAPDVLDGSVTVETIFEHIPTNAGGVGIAGISFTAITFSYDLTVGIYDEAADAANGGVPYDHIPKEQARVVGTATLHLAAELPD